MRVFQRVSHSVSFGIESLLDSLENQEAVARATIRQMEQGAGRVRVRRKAAERDLAKLEEQAAKLRRDVELWSERALRLKEDRDKAFECLRRRNSAEREAERLAGQIDQQRTLLAGIREDERAIDAKLAEVKQREAALVTREVRAKANANVGSLSDIDGVFDRWEARIGDDEAGIDASRPLHDAFAKQLDDDEEAARLEAQFAALVSGEVRS
jgi:phage shock protein A